MPAAAVLRRVLEQRPELRVHLVGHSFGARLVTAAASGLPSDSHTSLTLLQGAFSHNALSSKFDQHHDGPFRTVLADRRLTGPVVITHTKNDVVVGIAYPLASRIARDGAAGLGDQDDPYGGMGRNGAQHTPEVAADETELRDVRGAKRLPLCAGQGLQSPGGSLRERPGRHHGSASGQRLRSGDHGALTGPPGHE